MPQPGTLHRRYFDHLVQMGQVVLDLMVVILACVAALVLHRLSAPLDKGFWDPSYVFATYREVFSIIAAVSLVCFHQFGMYAPIRSALDMEEFKWGGIIKRLVLSSLTAFLVVSTLIVFLSQTTASQGPVGGGVADDIGSWFVQLYQRVSLSIPGGTLSRPVLLLAFMLIPTFMVAGRFFCFRGIQELHRQGLGNRNAVVIGDGPAGESLKHKLQREPALGLRFVGWIAAVERPSGVGAEGSEVLGTTADLERLLDQHDVSEVLVALPEAPYQDVVDLSIRLEQLGVTYSVMTNRT